MNTSSAGTVNETVLLGADDVYILVLLLGLPLHWSSYQPLMMSLPDELVHSNLTMAHSLVELPKGSPVSLHSN